MDWWNSFETVSKIQTALAVLLTVFGFITLTFKVRGDHLKKAADKVKADEQMHLEEALKQTTVEAHAMAVRLDQHDEEERLRALERHFPKEKVPFFLSVAAEGLSQTVTIVVEHVKTDDPEPIQFALEIARIFDPKADKTVEASVLNGAPAGITVVESTDVTAPSKAANNIQRAFEAVGLKCGYSTAATIERGTLCIFVGRKE